jgi:hypothetical protein
MVINIFLKEMKKMKQEKNKIKWLRVSYWTGAIIDLIYAIALLFSPRLIQFLWQLDAPIQETDLMWTKYFGSIVFSWTCLLFWADRKPLERKGVLLLTCYPVIGGLIAVYVYSIILNLADPIILGIRITGLSLVFILLSFSYFYSKKRIR